MANATFCSFDISAKQHFKQSGINHFVKKNKL